MNEKKEIHTKVGLLRGVTQERMDSNGVLRSCTFDDPNKIEFQGEIYIPKYTESDFRTRHRNAITFYKTGELKSIYLEEQQEIKSPIGMSKVEMVTFYQSGRIHRIFPVYGQISGYWSEQEESQWIPVSSIIVAGEKIEAKFSCICFYESGAIKSLTLWPNESIRISTLFGKIKVRYGVSLYEDGTIESVEPEQSVVVTYENAKIVAYDNHPIGIHGDKNSLGFYRDGSLRTVTTMITAIALFNDEQSIQIKPKIGTSQTDIEKMELFPIKAEFTEDYIRITDSSGTMQEFETSRYQLKTEQIAANLKLLESCTDCSSCSGCGHSNVGKE